LSWPRVFWPSEARSLEERRQLLRRDGPRLRVIFRNPFKSDVAPLEIDAVVDSGASCICISRRIVKELELQRTGATRMIAVGSDHTAGVYAATLVVPELDFDQFLPVVAPDKVHSAPAVLLGRTFLEYFDFSYNGLAGTFTFHREAGHGAPPSENMEEG